MLAATGRPPHRIGLLLSRSSERQLLGEALRAGGCLVRSESPAEATLDGWHTLALILADEPAARQCGDRLVALKARSTGAFLPLVVTLPPGADGEEWIRSGFDEVLREPLVPADLVAHVDALLRIRAQADAALQGASERLRLLLEFGAQVAAALD